MKIKRQNGFAPVETVLILIIIGLVAFIAWYVYHTKSNTDATLGNTANTQTEVSTSGTVNNSVLTTKTDSKGAKYLADINGKSLYTYDKDTSGKSNCTGTCLTTWPIYEDTSSSSTLPTDITTITHSDGKKQYAYKGMALYYYTGDTKAGDVTGSGVGGFSLAKP